MADLSFGTPHLCNFQILSEGEFGNTLETLFEVRLDPGGVRKERGRKGESIDKNLVRVGIMLRKTNLIAVPGCLTEWGPWSQRGSPASHR